MDRSPGDGVRAGVGDHDGIGVVPPGVQIVVPSVLVIARSDAAFSKKLSVLGELAVVRTMFETTGGVEGGKVTAPLVVEVWPRWL